MDTSSEERKRKREEGLLTSTTSSSEISLKDSEGQRSTSRARTDLDLLAAAKDAQNAARFRVFIKDQNGKTHTTRITATTTVIQVKEKLVRRGVSPASLQILKLADTVLSDEKTMAHLNVGEGSLLHVAVDSQELEISVREIDGPITKIIAKRTDTIAILKQKISQKNGTPVHLQRLLFAGHELESSRRLDSYNIPRNASLSILSAVRYYSG